LNRVVVIPVTSNIERLYPAETYIDIGEKRGKAMGDQITAVSKLRLGSKIGELSGTDLDRVGDTVLLHLGLPLSARGVN
jgi:mRNA interferase MazF